MKAGEGVLLEDCLKRLRLPAMLRGYPECVRQAQESSSSFESFLLDLATRELEQRRANQLQRRLKEARFPVMKTLEQTDVGKWPAWDGRQLRELAGCSWIVKRDNLTLIGKHGTGKSHAATVLGVEACRRGHRVLFYTAAQLVNRLIEAREERQLHRLQKRLEKVELLIVDLCGDISNVE
jgi:DNA replication protein DnaC